MAKAFMFSKVATNVLTGNRTAGERIFGQLSQKIIKLPWNNNCEVIIKIRERKLHVRRISWIGCFLYCTWNVPRDIPTDSREL